MAEKILTVSIAAYNVEKYIRKCIESIYMCGENTKRKIEVIAVDDGSTDNTSCILDEIKDEIPELIVVHKKNGGYGSTINASLSIANGKYFKQLDGDDWFESLNIDSYIDYLDKVDSDIVVSPHYCDFEVTGESKIVPLSKMFSECQNICDLESDFKIVMHELAFKTSIAKENKIVISENCFYTDNELVLLPFLYSKTIGSYDKGIYHYRIGREGQSISKSGVKKHYQDIRKVSSKIMKKGLEDIVDDSAGKKKFVYAKISEVNNSVYIYYMIKNTREARDELIKYDHMMKRKYPMFYELRYGRVVRVFRILPKFFYKPLARYVLSKM